MCFLCLRFDSDNRICRNWYWYKFDVSVDWWFVRRSSECRLWFVVREVFVFLISFFIFIGRI